MQKLAPPSTVQSIRDFNQTLVLRCIDRQPGVSRTGIAQQIGLTNAAVSRISRELIDCRLVVEGKEIVNSLRPGRRHVGLTINPTGAYVLSACLALSETRLTLRSIGGRTVADATLREAFTASAEETVAAIATKADGLRRQARVARKRILGLGVVTSGAIGHGHGIVHTSSLSSLSGLPLGGHLEAALDMPVRLETVGNALNLAQMRAQGSGGGRSTSLLIHVAIGLGASWIVDGALHRGEHDERLIGHIPISGSKAACVCGARGCLMTAVSGFAILRDLHGHAPRPTKIAFADENETDALNRAIERARAGDRKAAALFQRAGERLGQELFGICAALPPDQVTLAGPVAQVAAFNSGFMSGIERSFGNARRAPPVVSVIEIGYLQATECFSLETFLFDPALNAKQRVAG